MYINLEAAVQMSNMWRRYPTKHMKGNHRRTDNKDIYYLWGYRKHL